jgi:hypothetical protein
MIFIGLSLYPSFWDTAHLSFTNALWMRFISIELVVFTQNIYR